MENPPDLETKQNKTKQTSTSPTGTHNAPDWCITVSPYPTLPLRTGIVEGLGSGMSCMRSRFGSRKPGSDPTPGSRSSALHGIMHARLYLRRDIWTEVDGLEGERAATYIGDVLHRTYALSVPKYSQSHEFTSVYILKYTFPLCPTPYFSSLRQHRLCPRD